MTVTDIHDDRRTRPRPRHARERSRVLVVLVAGIAAQLALVAAFASAMGNPTLTDARVGLVEASAPTTVAAAFSDAGSSTAATPAIRYVPLGSAADAEAAVRAQALPAAVVLDPSGGTLLVAGAAGPTLVAAITTAVDAQSAAAHLPMTVRDLVPLPATDPHALDTFLLVIGWVVGGYLGMMLLSRTVPGAFGSVRGGATLLSWTAVYAVASAVLAVVLVDPVLGVITGHPWSLILAGSLTVFAVSSFTAALLSLLGAPGLIIAIGSLVVLGNPTSGGSVPDQMLSGGWRFLAEVLPTNAGVELARSLTYFDGQLVGRPLIVLGTCAAVSGLVLTVMAWRRNPESPAPEPPA